MSMFHIIRSFPLTGNVALANGHLAKLANIEEKKLMQDYPDIENYDEKLAEISARREKVHSLIPLKECSTT